MRKETLTVIIPKGEKDWLRKYSFTTGITIDHIINDTIKEYRENLVKTKGYRIGPTDLKKAA